MLSKSQLGSRQLKAYLVSFGDLGTHTSFSRCRGGAGKLCALDLRVGGYGSYPDEMLNPQSALAKFEPDVVLIILDLEEMAGRLPELCADGIGDGVENEVEQCVARVAQLLRSFRSGNSCQAARFRGSLFLTRLRLATLEMRIFRIVWRMLC